MALGYSARSYAAKCQELDGIQVTAALTDERGTPVNDSRTRDRPERGSQI